MAADLSAANSPTSSSPDDEPRIVCFDPANPSQACPICGGLGVIKYDVPLDDPRWGKLQRCPNRQSVDAARVDLLRQLGNMSALAHKTFSGFETTRVGYSAQEQQSLENARNLAQKYAETREGWLLLEGGYGTGKTHLAAAVGNAFLAQGTPVIFITTPDLLDHLRSAYSPSSEVLYDDFFERVRGAPLLILDDLGVENPSPWAQEKLFQLLNHRYLHHLPTVITTNQNLERLDPRIRSRLGDARVITHVIIRAPDYRTMKPRAENLLSKLPLYSEYTFDTFRILTTHTQEEQQNLQRALRAAYAYAENPKGWFILIGGYGTGKTHLAAAIANHWQQRGQKAILITATEVLDAMRATFNDQEREINLEGVLHVVRTAPLLVLDDLSPDMKGWAYEKMFQIVDYRFVANLPTVITTSQQLEVFPDRMQSRLLDTRICHRFGIKAAAFALRLPKPNSR